MPAESKGGVRLVIDIGLKTQRSLRAKVLRADDELDLALLKTDANSGLTALEMGKDESLHETAPIVTFGFPFGRNTTVRNEAYPNITVLPSRITSLRSDNNRLEGVQFDGQLNPGNSGGPVLDESGRVIGVAVATVRGAALNLAIPVGRLVDFLNAPGLVFDPPPLTYKDRSLPVTWTIKVLPAKPDAKLPEKLTVSVTVADGIGEPRKFAAQSVGNGLFRVKVTPVPLDPDRKVDLEVRFASGQQLQFQVKDGPVRSWKYPVLAERFASPFWRAVASSRPPNWATGVRPDPRPRKGQGKGGKKDGHDRLERGVPDLGAAAGHVAAGTGGRGDCRSQAGA